MSRYMGGFFISNKHEFKLKKGSSFKKGDIISINNTFFDTDNNEYLGGVLMKIAAASGFYEMEDSSLIRQGLSERMSTYLTMKKEIKLGPNTNIEKIVKTGDSVQVGTPLIIFEQSFDESSANKLLDKLGTDFDEQISELSKNIKRSSYTGVIEDVKAYYNTDFENLSPSLQKTVNDIYKPVNAKKRVLNKYLTPSEQHELILAPTTKIDNPDKIKGVNIKEGVLIEIYIKYKVKVNIGDKIVFFGPLKSEVGKVVSDDVAPYSELYPDEPIDALLPNYSVLNRLTGDAPINIYGNKSLIMLKRRVSELLLGKAYY